jgi:hypothetical protein
MIDRASMLITLAWTKSLLLFHTARNPFLSDTEIPPLVYLMRLAAT